MVGDTSYDMADGPRRRGARDRRRLGLSSGRSCWRRPAPSRSSTASSSCSTASAAARHEAVLSARSTIAPAGRRASRPARRPAGAHAGPAAPGAADRGARRGDGGGMAGAGRDASSGPSHAADPAGQHGASIACRRCAGARSTRCSATPRPIFCAIAPPSRSSWSSASSTPGSPCSTGLAAAYGVRLVVTTSMLPVASPRRRCARLRGGDRGAGRLAPGRPARGDHGARLARPRPLRCCDGRARCRAGACGEPAGRAVRDRALGPRRRGRAPPRGVAPRRDRRRAVPHGAGSARSS